MKIILLQGDDKQRLDARFYSLLESARTRSYRIIDIEEQGTDFRQILREKDLFQENKFINVERFSYLTADDLKIIKEHINDENIVLCIKSENPVTPSKLKIFGSQIKIENFILPKVIWSFLDSIKIGQAKRAIGLYKQAIEGQAVELVFYLISQRFIQLFLAKTKPSELKSAPWQVVKLQNQSEDFTVDKLKKIIADLAQLDVDAKTGKAQLNTTLDFFIATALE